MGKRLLYKNSWYWIRFWICWFSNFHRKKWFANRIIGRVYSRLEFSTLQKFQIIIEISLNYLSCSKTHWSQLFSEVVLTCVFKRLVFNFCRMNAPQLSRKIKSKFDFKTNFNSLCFLNYVIYWVFPTIKTIHTSLNSINSQWCKIGSNFTFKWC